MAEDPYTDDEYDDTYKKVHGDESAKEKYTSDATDDSFFPSGVGRRFSPRGWGLGQGPETVDAEYDQPAGGETEEGGGARDLPDDEDTWLDEGVIGMVLIAGIALFLFPEPATSAVGIGLIAIGVLAWVVDWLG